MTSASAPESPVWEAVQWKAFASAAPEMAEAGGDLLARRPAYLATVDASGQPRVHPVTPFVTDGRLFLFMEPTSPKGHDLRARGWFALHNGVPDAQGTGGEIALRGSAVLIDDAATRRVATEGCPYEPAARYVLAELLLHQVTVTRYESGEPVRDRWSSRSASTGHHAGEPGLEVEDADPGRT